MDLHVDTVGKSGRTVVGVAGMLKEAVAGREEDMSTTEVDRDMVVEGFFVCHNGQIQATVAQDGSNRVDKDLKHSI